MRITDLQIENVGPFVGENTIDLSLRNKKQRVILIGGKNGAGKTTLFNAIRIGLYGCRAFGFESENSEYLDKIKRMINKDALIRKQGVSRIVISIIMDDGKNDYKYTFDRMWKLSNKTMKEACMIYRDGEPLSEVEKSDFQSYLLQLIPPDMFKFFFFDGEQISEFVFNGRRNTDFKAAFLKLCGLDTMELISENLTRITNSQKKDSAGVVERYFEAKAESEKFSEELYKLENEKSYIDAELVKIEESLAVLQKDYSERGGITQKEYQAMLAQISKEESKREEIRRWLKDTANSTIPFIILNKELELLKEQLVKEEAAETNKAMRSGLTSKKVDSTLKKLFKSIGIDYYEDLADKTVEVLLDSLQGDASESIVNVSKQERLELIAFINSMLAFDKRRVSAAVEDIEDSLKSVKRIRKKLDISDTSGADDFYAEKEKLLKNKETLIERKLSTEQNIESTKREGEAVELLLKKAKGKYEEYLKVQSINDTSARALLAFEELQNVLYTKYIRQMEQSFKKSFDSLINKSDLIDGIKIDDDLQVYPYKNKKFETSFINNELRELGEAGFIDRFGKIALDALDANKSTRKEVILPVEVKQQLSAGERQIFIMALYKALSTLNKTSVPYIIDTPFARIDAMHRERILNNFFMLLSGQIIILSTDEEITRGYTDLIKEMTARTYLLEHDSSDGSSKIYKNKYFGE